MTDLPTDVREHYRELARKRKWLGFLTDHPLDPDRWRLRTIDRGTFYELWDNACR